MKIFTTFHGLPISADYTKGTTPDSGPDPDDIEDVAVDADDEHFLPREFKEWLFEQFEAEMIEKLMEEI